MARQKPLPKEINGVTIISDCGVGLLYPNSRTKTRNAIVECTICKKHRKINIYPLKQGQSIVCPICNSAGERNSMYKHGESDKNRTRTYTIWQGMRDRCNNESNKDYHRYGGRGIDVCDEWADYATFKEWAGDRLEDPDGSIERKEVDKGYKPSNCTVIPTYLQAYNRRNGMDLYTAIEMAKDIKKYGKRDKYLFHYMSLYPHLKDHHIRQFVLYCKHIDKLVELGDTYVR